VDWAEVMAAIWAELSATMSSLLMARSWLEDKAAIWAELSAPTWADSKASI
jgi:hypothetical protein